MRAQEFEGIEKLPAGLYRGGKAALQHRDFFNARSKVKPLPGDSGFLYTIGTENIEIWDPKGQDYIDSITTPVRRPRESQWSFNRRFEFWKHQNKYAASLPGQLIGKLKISSLRWFPLPHVVKVETITVDEDYRGRGIAKALYGIVLTIMKLPLISGDAHTPGGRVNWVSLASIPGVEVKGFVGLEESEIVGKKLDTIMGKLGGNYIGRGGYDIDFFAFDVTPNTTGKELEAYIKTHLSKIYGSTVYVSGLYAVWSGA